MACWGQVPLYTLSSQKFVEMYRGCAELLLIGKEMWEKTLGGVVGRLDYAAEVQKGTIPLKMLSLLVPPGVGVRDGFVDLKMTQMPNAFRCILKDAAVSGQKGSSEPMFVEECVWNIAAIGHNSLQALSAASDVDCAAPVGMIVRATKELSLTALPLHASCSIVFAVRTRSVQEKSGWRVLGYAVLQLDPCKDRDVSYRNVAILDGPFSTPDRRMVKLDSESPYHTLPLWLEVTVQYFDTPVPAEKYEEILSTPLRQQQRKKREEPLDGGGAVRSLPQTAPATERIEVLTGSEPERTAAVPSESAIPRAEPAATQLAPPVEPPPAVPTSTKVAVAPVVPVSLQVSSPATVVPVPATVGSTSPAPDLATYKMLCSVLEELQALRQAQHRISAKLEEPLPKHKRETQSTEEPAEPHLFDLVDLAPRRVAIPFVVRCIINEGLQPIIHPLWGTRL